MLLLWGKWSENLELQPGIESRDSWIQGFGTSQYTTEKPFVVLMLFKKFSQNSYCFPHAAFSQLFFTLANAARVLWANAVMFRKAKVVTSEGWIAKEEFFRYSTSVFRYFIIIYDLCFQTSFPFGRASCPVLPCHAHSGSSKNAKVSEILIFFFSTSAPQL